MLPSQAGAAAALGRGSALGGSLNRTPTGRPGGGGGGGTRGANGGRVPGNGAGLGPGRLEREAAAAATTTPAPTAGALYSGSEGDSESGEEEELGAERRGLKRSLSEMELGVVVGGPEAAAAATGGYGPVSGAVSGAKPGKKTRGRVKIKMEFIDNKLRRYTTFSKRKTGIMKKKPRLLPVGCGTLLGVRMLPMGPSLKAYELSTLTGTQVLLLVASETGHVYTFATRKLQPMITSETGKALIQTCLNSPDSPPRSDPTTDQRMSATGFEETDLTYQVSESDSSGETKDTLKPAFTVTNLPGTTSTIQTAPSTSTTMQVSSGPSFPITNYLAPVSASVSPSAVSSANGTVLKSTGSGPVSSGGLMQLPTSFTLMPGGAVAQQVPVQAIQVHQAPQQASPSRDSSTDLTQTSSSGTVTLPATIMTSSVPTTVGGHMMYPSPHAVMYAPTSGLADGSLTVLNAFSQAPSTMQVSHSQVQEQGGVPQVFLTAPSGTVQIPVSAVQLHQMAVIGQQAGSSSNLTELQVVNLDAAHSTKSD
ncbi:serum response factor isoform X2 [Lagenorhynchus albirostris]|uniref:Serum response factor n=2 Tax=Odontoceti TaxID=9722 RepID=A0A2Y9ES03_PHYMC|nr:serum response factor isoform X1 [Physeter catodon]XP_019805490.1 serum response factor isoform X1 [Tursiops truncatus]XP_026983114.1 serum response factor isoform X1 [Lagenorhynchus obliquidens]XP_030726533.1 serum response factor isoform X2 [Globicephala melas]XP_032505134.1 serum response factor isoform X1 [Phocoena sinus]XP_058934193.1 serum response factor isoform X1 [Kogia breviceps]XP_059877770.1 serum response factor isoform X2 [Delphinus delphis]XP_060018936.1 serum response fact|eukprot:XP_007107625.1 serum response factor isoform X1 [Physeter catodon]